MGYGVRVIMEGDSACFTRPEMKAERVSYDVITPSAARGILEAVYWHPGITWVIDRIHVLNEIQFDSIRRNELGSKIPFTNITSAMKTQGKVLRQIITEDRMQRATLYLKDVKYGIEAHFIINPEKASALDTPAKHYNIFLRRVREGQFYQKPCFGCREFPANVSLVEDNEDFPPGYYSDNPNHDLGWMLRDMKYGENEKSALPEFYRAVMRNGIIDVAAQAKERVS
ncbi:type I-C CRISPR-associated protein Cas5 [Clostridia bacterium]|nr:type I-C CRISPR-associated protein Cas5 [Clostridia bacterium]